MDDHLFQPLSLKLLPLLHTLVIYSLFRLDPTHLFDFERLFYSILVTFWTGCYSLELLGPLPCTCFAFVLSPLCALCRMSGNTALTAAQAPDPVQVPDQDLVHALAAEAETTSSEAPPRYGNTSDPLILRCSF